MLLLIRVTLLAYNNNFNLLLLYKDIALSIRVKYIIYLLYILK